MAEGFFCAVKPKRYLIESALISKFLHGVGLCILRNEHQTRLSALDRLFGGKASGGNLAGVLAGYTIGQIGTLAIAYYGALFVMQIATYNEMLGMPRMDGSSASLGNFAAKAGGALGAWLTSILL